MQEQWDIRRGLPGKYEYFDLFLTTGWNSEYKLSADEMFEALENSRLVICIYDMNRMVATGRLISDAIVHALILDMVVHPEYQGRGLGRIVMNELLSFCMDNNIRDVQLFCAEGKAGFYTKAGFIKRRDDAPGMELPPWPGWTEGLK